MNEGKILVFKGYSRYNVLRYATDVICNEWNKMGYQVEVIDLCDNQDLNLIFNKLKDNYIMIFSMQCLLFDFKNSDNSSFLEHIQSKYIGWIFDHPIYHRDRINSAKEIENLFITCIDRRHLEYIEENYKIKDKVHYLPHGGFVAKKKIEYSEKSIEIFSPGSYINSEDTLILIQGLPKSFALIAKQAIDYIIEDSDISPEKALYKCFESINFSYTYDDVIELEWLIELIDTYIRAYYREKVIKELINSGFKVTVTGKGWNEFQSYNKENIIVISEEGLDITEVVELIANSKICLNIAPSLTRGMHERLLTAMINKSVCVTPYNNYLSKYFTDEESILYIKLSEISKIINDIKNILNNDELGRKISNKAYELTVNRHSWEYRAHELINFIYR